MTSNTNYDSDEVCIQKARRRISTLRSRGAYYAALAAFICGVCITSHVVFFDIVGAISFGTAWWWAEMVHAEIKSLEADLNSESR